MHLQNTLQHGRVRVSEPSVIAIVYVAAIRSCP